MLKLKKYLDPKNPGKSQEFQKLPKYFQIGTVIDGGGLDEFNNKLRLDTEGAMQRVAKGKRKGNLVDQFIELDEELMHSRKKFGEIQMKKQKIFKFNQKFKRLKQFSKRIKTHK